MAKIFSASNIHAFEFHAVIIWFSMYASRENFVKVWGETLGNHFYDKWKGYSDYKGSDYATMQLFYDIEYGRFELLFSYLESINFKG